MREENIQTWAEAVEFGYPPPVQSPLDEHGESLRNAGECNQQTSTCQPDTQNKDAEIGTLERVSLQQKHLFENGGFKKVFQDGPMIPMKHYSKNYRVGPSNTGPKVRDIPRKPVLSRNEATLHAPQAAVLRNEGTNKRLERMPTYAERVRDLGYPNNLFLLPMAEIAPKNFLGVDCTSANVVKPQDRHKVGHGHYTENLHLSAGEWHEEQATGRTRAGSNLSRSNAIRRPSNPVVERTTAPKSSVKPHGSRRGH